MERGAGKRKNLSPHEEGRRDSPRRGPGTRPSRPARRRRRRALARDRLGLQSRGAPHFVGVLGRARRDIVAEYCGRADLVIAIGYDPVEFNYEEWLKKGVPLISIDTVPADIASAYPVPW